MCDFMDYIQLAFYDASKWNRDNSYSRLTTTANALLDFSTPERLKVNLSSLSTPHFATTYTLGTVGLIDGSISYLFTTIPLHNTPSRSSLIPLRKLVPGYRQIYPPSIPIEYPTANDHSGIPAAVRSKADNPKMKPTLLHATLHLPPPTTLTGLFICRLSSTTQLSLAVCSSRAPASKSAPQATLLTQIFHDTGKYSSEFLFSTDNALLGFKGLWNFGPDPRKPTRGDPASQRSRPLLSLLSAGGEVYYSPVSSVVGLSTGLRFATLPAATENAHSAFPYTLTLTLTPLTGSMSTTYSLLASPNLAFSSRFGFNVYSWESEMVAGCELWRRSKSKSQNIYPSAVDNLAWARLKMGVPDTAVSVNPEHELSYFHKEGHNSSHASDSVIKVRVDQSWNIRALWEGRVKELLISAGVALGPASRSTLSYASPVAPGGLSSYGWKSVGVSVLYAS
ncbi:mitochondrial protein [Paracoccidioides lutzii Pb01]|uniref:Mitochondrial distribution and morphology protein 10 n=1 Tax=Paracoccidioides lutzii (strain ATCC MYA-826 / Pb01) TaxID=502779 RepID=MDM10_PARBA|nr:mitochondrial protein [Paracoccidioides lutzii Pb01]C1GVA2.3 RecName: Full=Mitochondrial distribution and morphology protein 10; AltName: Full=Mitochondrial inheritance component MDM10 [Paracoccidioides lutzii Pb01]EEH40520.2 mitochondrial protein [Paracoccidioides lutzii Pb01]